MNGKDHLFHKLCFHVLHIQDKKFHSMCLPVKNGTCTTCLEEMRSGGSWITKRRAAQDHIVQTGTGLKEKGKRRKLASIVTLGSNSSSNLKKHKIAVNIDHPEYFQKLKATYVEKDKVFRKYIQQYAKTLNHGIGVDYHQVDFKEFQKLPYWTLYVNEAGDLFTGYFCDPNTPVEHHVNDSLHLLITVMNVSSHLLFLAAQRIESIVQGMGVHSLVHGLRCSGFDILAKNVLDDAKLKLGDKMKTMFCPGDGKITETITFDKATANEFKKYIKQKAAAERVGELFQLVVLSTMQNAIERSMAVAAHNTKGKQISKILEVLENMLDTEVVNFLTHEEHQYIDRNLFIRQVNAFEFSKESNIEIEAVVAITLQGRDARKMYNGGFSSVLAHMNSFAILAQLENRERMDGLMEKNAKLNRKTEKADNAVKQLLNKLTNICDEEKICKKELDEKDVENLCSDVASSLESLQQHDVDASSFQAEILNSSRDMLQLYS
jgi:hypothetical protein